MMKLLTSYAKQQLCQHQMLTSIDVPFRGRILKVAGDRTFDV